MLKINLRAVPKVLILAPVALLALSPHAQQSKTKVGIVNVQTVVAALPGGASYAALSKKADADVQTQAKAVQVLLVKANASGATAASRSAYTTAAKKYQASAQSYQKQLQTAFAPLAGRVNTAVASVAKAGGFSVVLDQRVASTSRLIIYANSQTTDLTPGVVAKLKSKK